MVIVRLKQPVMEHRVRTRDFDTWLNAAPKSPAEMVLKKPLARTLRSLGFDGDLIREGKTVGDFVGVSIIFADIWYWSLN
jgi:hypothetical protein